MSTQTKNDYTTGPWSYWPDSAGGVVSQDSTTSHVAKPTDLPNREANARLMAAAPEFYEAAKILEDLMTNHSEEFEIKARAIHADLLGSIMIDKFREAIAKAEFRF